MSIGNLTRKPNLLIIMTDQQRTQQHFPADWSEKNLPSMNRLKKNGLSFDANFCNTCMCSPSRASFFTSTYPAEHGVKEVLNTAGEGGNDTYTMQNILRANYQNMAKILETAGYNVVYKGKWHMTKPVRYDQSQQQLLWSDPDNEHLEHYWRFKGWNQPDAAATTISALGGGIYNNDGRYTDGLGGGDSMDLPSREISEARSAIRFLQTYDGAKPFCLIVSLVNPHDIWAYPGTGEVQTSNLPVWKEAGYKLEDFADMGIGLPATVNENLATKPLVQQSVITSLDEGLGALKSEQEQLAYVNFYAYLQTVVDKQITKVLDALDEGGWTEDTLIVRTSDHGEMGLAHGGLRQKMETAYEETIRIPLIFSNPKLYPKPLVTDSLASLVDVLPTLATIAEVPDRDRWVFRGYDLVPILKNPKASVQDNIHFTYDDVDASQPFKKPNRIRTIRERDWKYSVYFDPDTGYAAQYEMYDLKNDPMETRNLAHKDFSKPRFERERQRLHRKLTRKMAAVRTTPDRIVWPKVSGCDVTATHPDTRIQSQPTST